MALWIIGLFLSLSLGSWLGYQFCMARYRPKFLLKVMKLQNEAINGEVSPEDTLKKIEDIKRDYPELNMD